MRLIEDSLTKNIYSSLTEDFWNPCEYFTIIQNFDIDMNKWNNASQEERDAMVRPQLEEFWKQYGKEIIDKGMLETLFDDLEDSNFHTESRILRDIIDKNNINESLESTNEVTTVHTGFSDEQTKDILKSVIGQLGDGIWENTPIMERFWMYMDFDTDGNEAIMKFNTNNRSSGFKDKDESQLKRWLAGKIKQIVKREGLDWDRNNTEICNYLDRGSGVTVKDAYRVYDRLLGRIDRIKESESIPNMNDTNFEETVKRDFRLFLMDKYGDELYKDVTEDDVNEYFTGMFYDIWDNDDLDSANEAERIIRNEYNCLDSREHDDYKEYDDGDTNWAAEEEADATERMERRYGSMDESVEEHDLSKDLFGDEAASRMSQKEKDLERDLQYVRDIMAGKTVIDDKYHEELSLDMAKAWLRRDFVYVNGLSVYSPDEINKRLADEYPDIFGVNESVIEPIEGKQDYELDDYADKLQQELKSIYNDDEVNALRFEILDLLNKKERANNRASGNGLKYNDKLKELIKKAESYLSESDNSLNEALDSNIDSIVNDVLSGNDVYVCLDEKDYSSEEGSNIYKIEYSYSIERPEDYDNGYNSGWDRGQDEEFDKKQDERFEKATKAYEEGEVFEFNCVKIEDGKIQYTGFCLLKCFGIEELRYNLEYYKAKRIGVKTISSFEDLTESAKSKKSKKEKKEDKRVVMQQGNVTCFKENDSTYYVFENESDNEVEYDSQEEAMQDFMERVGINPNDELKEE